MSAQILLDRAAAGISITLDPPDTLVIRGDLDTRARLLPEVRSHKAELIALLSHSEKPRRLWLIELLSGERFSSSFCPPATRAEILSWYPGSDVRPEEEPTKPKSQRTTSAPARTAPRQGQGERTPDLGLHPDEQRRLESFTRST